MCNRCFHFPARAQLMTPMVRGAVSDTDKCDYTLRRVGDYFLCNDVFADDDVNGDGDDVAVVAL